ncbi:acyl-CoA dehydrogenase family protein [Embleya sp. AB8]|uniref:acyl-CoA dehydrogenase family protein n=1 Tax=Embleya sp. AB8 TaxID=3156304 RepID=UPI003C70BCA6
MDGSNRDEVGEFAAGAAALIARHWGTAAAAAGGDLDRLWEVGAAHGWFDLGGDDALAEVIGLVRALGRAACPLPVLDGFVAARLFAEYPGLAGAIGDGGVRVVTALPGGPDGPGAGVDCLVEAGAAATHVLRLPYGGGPVGLYRIAAADPVEGPVGPGWRRVRLGPPLAYALLESAAEADRMLTLVRLGLAARALGAAERGAAAVLAHACGADAARERAVAGRVELDAGELLVADAVRRYAEGGADWVLAAELAVAQVRRAASRVRFGAHHPVGPTSCVDEHEAPWLYGRVQVDLAYVRAFASTGGDVADRLLDPDADAELGLPEPWLGPDGDALRQAVRKVVAGRPVFAVSGADDPDTVAELAGHGWFVADGGAGGSAAERFALRQEACRHRLPITEALTTATVFGAPIARYGTPAQRARLLPAIRRGAVRIAPTHRTSAADFDPATVRVAAERDRADWTLTGERLWIRDAERANHLWVAARTDPEAETAHGGLTVFLVPTDAPGVTIRPSRSPAGESGCVVLLDQVRVRDAARIGVVDGGWPVITETFAAEPILRGDLAAMLHRDLIDLITVLRTAADPEPAAGPRGSAARAALAELVVRTQALRLVSTADALSVPGPAARPYAAAAGLLGAELAQDFGPIVLDLLGLGPTTALIPGSGEPAAGFASYPADSFDGAAGTLHRDLLARAFVLPGRV